MHSIKCSSSPAISGTFAIERIVCRGYSITRSSLAVWERNISACSVVAQRNSGILFHKNQKDCPLLNNNFFTSLAFLVDFLTHVSNLNTSLPGKGTTVCFMHKKVLDFKNECRLLKNRLQQHNFFHFPQLTALIFSKEMQVDKVPITLFCNIFDAVLLDFSDHFQDFEKITKTSRLVAFPNLVETEKCSNGSPNGTGRDKEWWAACTKV